MPDQRALRLVLAPLRLLVDSRDEVAAATLLDEWGASQPLRCALAEYCTRTRLTAWQQLLSWARQNRVPTQQQTDLLLLSRLVKMVDMLHDKLEDAPQRLDSAAERTSFLQTLIRMSSLHVAARTTLMGMEGVVEVLTNCTRAVAETCTSDTLGMLQAWIRKTNELIRDTNSSPSASCHSLAQNDGADTSLILRMSDNKGDSMNGSSTETKFSECKGSSSDGMKSGADPLGDGGGSATAGPYREIYAPFASPRTLRLLAAGARQDKSAQFVLCDLDEATQNRSCSTARRQVVKDMRHRSVSHEKRGVMNCVPAKSAAPREESNTFSAHDTSTSKKQPIQRARANERQRKRDVATGSSLMKYFSPVPRPA
eukprot:scaffold230996_cov40-Tisochrysis_lutea.AAC.1